MVNETNRKSEASSVLRKHLSRIVEAFGLVIGFACSIAMLMILMRIYLQHEPVVTEINDTILLIEIVMIFAGTLILLYMWIRGMLK